MLNGDGSLTKSANPWLTGNKLLLSLRWLLLEHVVQLLCFTSYLLMTINRKPIAYFVATVSWHLASFVKQ